jgi:hypothetical protein
MTPVEIVTFIKDSVVAIAAAVTATVAVVGLSNWNRELRGKAAFEVARALARATYKLRDEIRYCRSPFLAASEFPEGYAGHLGQTSNREEANALAYVYGNRWKSVYEALESFDTSTLEAEAMWGAVIREKTDALRQCVRELRVAIDAVIENTVVQDENFKTDREFERGMRGKVSTASGADNPLTQKIESAITEVESIIRPHLKRA